MDAISKALSSKHDAVIISHDLSDKMWISIEFDPDASGLSIELWVDDDFVEGIVATTVPGAMKALQELARIAFDVKPDLIYYKLASDPSYVEMVPYEIEQNQRI